MEADLCTYPSNLCIRGSFPHNGDFILGIVPYLPLRDLLRFLRVVVHGKGLYRCVQAVNGWKWIRWYIEEKLHGVKAKESPKRAKGLSFQIRMRREDPKFCWMCLSYRDEWVGLLLGRYRGRSIDRLCYSCVKVLFSRDQCRCRKAVQVRESHSSRNEGRLFMSCHSCGLFEWISTLNEEKLRKRKREEREMRDQFDHLIKRRKLRIEANMVF